VPCPADLELPPDLAENAIMGLGISAEAIRAVTVKFRGRYLGGSERMTRERWYRALNSAVCQDGRAAEISLRRTRRAETEQPSEEDELGALA